MYNIYSDILNSLTCIKKLFREKRQQYFVIYFTILFVIRIETLCVPVSTLRYDTSESHDNFHGPSRVEQLSTGVFFFFNT